MALRLSTFDESATSLLKNWSQQIEDRLKLLEKSGTISKQGGYVLQRLVTTTPPDNSWWLTPTHMSYRPLTNCLHGTIVNGLPAIVIDAFTMRIGHSDVINNGGQIATGLQWDTLYFVYYDDIDLSGGAQTYFCDRFKEVALVGDGRLFVGSVRTPLNSSSVDTIGNNDGGVGAQMGGHVARYGTAQQCTTSSSSSDFGTGVTNPTFCIDKNWNTCADAHATSTPSGAFNEAGSSRASVSVYGFGSQYETDRWYTHVRVKIKAGGSASGHGYGSNICYVRISVNGTVVQQSTGDSSAIGTNMFLVNLPDGTNLNGISVLVEAYGAQDSHWRDSVGTTASVQVYDVLVEADY